MRELIQSSKHALSLQQLYVFLLWVPKEMRCCQHKLESRLDTSKLFEMADYTHTSPFYACQQVFIAI